MAFWRLHYRSDLLVFKSYRPSCTAGPPHIRSASCRKAGVPQADDPERSIVAGFWKRISRLLSRYSLRWSQDYEGAPASEIPVLKGFREWF